MMPPTPATTAPSDSDERRLVTVETIAEVLPIPGADAIEAVVVRGWTVVAGKGQFATGDSVVYIEVDAALPLADERFAFLAARGTKQVDGREVHVLRTARLRGVYSQGIVFPLADFPELVEAEAGADLDLALGVTKWEPELPSGLAEIAPFPAFLRKTDAPRVQNLDDETWSVITSRPEDWVPTEKLDGSSLTAWRTADGVLHVAGRNWELNPASANVYWQAVGRHELDALLAVGEWLQGEVIGPGVQGNPLRIDDLRLVVFGFGDFDVTAPAAATTTRRPTSAWPDWVGELRAPVHDLDLPATIGEAVTQVEALRSLLAPGRAAEGIVWTRSDGRTLPELGDRAVWKSISARYLARNGG